MPVAPGWYPDPWRARGQRWWDGTAWTDPTAGAHPIAPDPHRELDDARRAAVWAKRGFIAYCIGRLVSLLVSIVVLGSVIDDFQQLIDSNGRKQPKTNGIQFLSTPASALSIVGLVGVIIWVTKAAKIAYNLHYPRTHGPVWAVLGWFVPIVNFWFPYQVVRDCLPQWN